MDAQTSDFESESPSTSGSTNSSCTDQNTENPTDFELSDEDYNMLLADLKIECEYNS